MADTDNKELMAFLEKQFAGINRQFEVIHQRLDNTASKDDLASTREDLRAEIASTREDLRAEIASTRDDLHAEIASTKEDLRSEISAAKEEVMRHTGVLIEEVNHKIDLLVEGRIATHEMMDRHFEENAREHARLEKMSIINSADIYKLDQRVEKVEGRV